MLFYKSRARSARGQCNRYIELLRTKLGAEPEGVEYRITRNDHEFGNYYDVVVAFDSSNLAARDYAFNAEANAPTMWDGPARKLRRRSS